MCCRRLGSTPCKWVCSSESESRREHGLHCNRVYAKSDETSAEQPWGGRCSARRAVSFLPFAAGPIKPGGVHPCSSSAKRQAILNTLWKTRLPAACRQRCAADMASAEKIGMGVKSLKRSTWKAPNHGGSQFTRIAVFCGASTGTSPVYMEAARALGNELAKRGLGIVYGGGSVGLMGQISSTVSNDSSLNW